MLASICGILQYRKTRALAVQAIKEKSIEPNRINEPEKLVFCGWNGAEVIPLENNHCVAILAIKFSKC